MRGWLHKEGGWDGMPSVPFRCNGVVNRDADRKEGGEGLLGGEHAWMQSLFSLS